jgi:hypothetical protein
MPHRVVHCYRFLVFGPASSACTLHASHLHAARVFCWLPVMCHAPERPSSTETLPKTPHDATRSHWTVPR